MPATPANSTANLTQSVTRALHILQCFTSETPTQRVADISARLGLTPSLVSRLLGTLEHEGLVERDDETGFYQLGKTIITLAGVALNHDRLRIEALEEMQRLASTLGLGVNLSILRDTAIFYLAHVDGPQAPRAYTLIGHSNPLHATGMGKVLLAFLPDVERDKIISDLTLHAYTAQTITDRDGLRGELDAVRAQGWACEIEELAMSRACIAAPIRDQRGQVVAAMSISGPIRVLNWNERRDLLIDTILEVVDRISIRLGYITAPRFAEGSWRPPLPHYNNNA